ncbi:MAG: UDP-N-acetylmuramoyl-L-alanine--D-glutamate ligase [Selenomonadaceae bacterium]|nr:UDP-N-acetylmuramoyl-L-alanine--D-glutamate ligase [Selenomonadaceae bacterium]MBR0102425.1 UDP-N-acetylmuramoyl-L-alanine--D-glutamate ligase [Selenomonadaceae bacterium]
MEKVLVIGAARSGIAAAKILHERGAQVILSDSKPELQLDLDGVEIKLGKQTEDLLSGVDKIIVSPAVPIKIPLLRAAASRGIPIISEVEFAYGLAKSPICAVTGTNGKTTTVTLLGLLLKEKFAKVGVGGNIGVPLCEVALEVGAGGYLAAEISSYQMEATRNFKPHISAILNITPDHLKRHGSMEVYQAMKEKIFAQQTAEDFLILNYDDERTREIKDRAACRVLYFSRQRELAEGAFIKDNRLVIRFNGTHELCTIDELGIKGGHNVENALAASLMAFLAGVDADKIANVLKTFQGVEHRIEFVRELDGVKYYNDSKATNTDSAIKALETFAGHIVLIAGGDDKGTDLADFLRLVNERVDWLILVGDAAARFKACALESGYPADKILEAGYSMERAIALAKNISRPPQVVLLSPACASFDMYRDFEERGRDFKRIVCEL